MRIVVQPGQIGGAWASGWCWAQGETGWAVVWAVVVLIGCIQVDL